MTALKYFGLLLLVLVFNLSYAVEVKLLDATDFLPLKRPLERYLKSDNMFFGYLDNTELA